MKTPQILPGNSFCLLVSLATVLTILDGFQMQFLSGFIWFFTTRDFAFSDVHCRSTWRLLSFLSIGIGHSWIACLWTSLILAHDRGNLKIGSSLLAELVTHISSLIEKASIPRAEPIYGYNASTPDFLQKILDTWREELSQAFSSIKTTEAIYLRNPSIQIPSLDISDRPCIPSSDILNVTDTAVNISRYCFLGAMMCISYILLANPLAPAAICATVLSFYLCKAADAITPGIAPGPKFKDGTYRVLIKVLGIEVSRGIGSSHQGVLHVPYHVCYGSPITIGPQTIPPYHIDQNRDLVTYSGPPQLQKVYEGENLYINAENDDTYSSYNIKLDNLTSSAHLTWSGVTQPGESGSPIYVLRPDTNNELKPLLVGLAGRFYRDSSGQVTEYTEINASESSLTIHKDEPIQIVTHPGSGKTFRKIPELVLQFVQNNPGKRVLVSGPTRVVCLELYQALSPQILTGLNIKDHPAYKQVNARVQIAAHSSALKMLLNRSRELSNIGMVIIDEAHVNSAETLCLRKYTRSLLPKITLVEMSATLGNTFDDASNYPIIDTQIREKELINTVLSELEKGRRVLVFVPGPESRVTKEIRAAVQEPMLLLARSTFNNVAPYLRDETYRLIISTDIAECGINIPNLDTVIDTSQSFNYIHEAGLTFGTTRIINNASRVQRRGRVGRNKTGRYFFCHQPAITSAITTAAQFDSDILSSGKFWSTGTEHPPVVLTDRQMEVHFSRDEPVYTTYLLFNADGSQRTISEMKETLQTLRGGQSIRECPDKKCPCNGQYLWFDERSHDLIVKICKA